MIGEVDTIGVALVRSARTGIDHLMEYRPLASMFLSPLV